jgi:ribosomal protein S18 acetylase RimI-like enzyme
VPELIWVTPDDWEEWRTIRLASLLDTPSAYGSTYEREVASAEQDWRDRLDGPAVMVRENGVPIAIGAAFRPEPQTLHIVAMYVAPAHRGRGLSRMVLDALVGHGRENGLRVQLSVNTDNVTARLAYLRYGFVPTGETRPLREGATDVCAELVLPDAQGFIE